MDYSLSDISLDDGLYSRVFYNDVPVVNGEAVSQEIVPNAAIDGMALINSSGTAIDPTGVLDESLIGSAAVSVSVQGPGSASGVDHATPGDYVTVFAKPDENATFTGWYDAASGKQVSTDMEYSFSVSGPMDLIANFKGPKAITPKLVLSKSSFTYNGKVQKPSVTVKDGNTVLPDSCYSISWDGGCVNAGTYKITVLMKGKYTGKAETTFMITKAANPLSVKRKTAKVSLKKVKKKKQILAVGKVLTIKKAQGKKAYIKLKGSSKKLSINKKTGKVTVKKGTKKGTYKLRVKVTSAGNQNYNAASKTVTIIVKVK